MFLSEILKYILAHGGFKCNFFYGNLTRFNAIMTDIISIIYAFSLFENLNTRFLKDLMAQDKRKYTEVGMKGNSVIDYEEDFEYIIFIEKEE